MTASAGPPSGSTPAPIAGLPTQLTRFIGREKEIAAVCDLVTSTRLLTLTGVGGAGKTRLALEVAARVAPRFDAIGWVDLAPLSDPELTGPVVAAALGYREEGGRTAVETMMDRVCEQATLVVLDNCEHLVEACAVLAEGLLRACPRITILATSREALGASGEQAWLVPPLSVPDAAPDAQAVESSEAGRLFLERARAVQPLFQLTDGNARAVAQVCRRLDGIPLAIELAAARVRVLTPEQIAARLDHAFKLLSVPGRAAVPRHRTLKETIDWSHALLDHAEAALFRRLSVFAGSFSLDAVEAICPDPPVSPDAVLDLLSAVVDKSLVVMETSGSEARYRLLETLRQYGHDRLVAAGEEAELRRRHARFFTDLVVERERDTFGGAGEPAWASRLVADEGNLRAACDWAEETGDYLTSLTLCAALHWHWFARGHFREGWQRLEAALPHVDRAPPLIGGKAYAAAAGTVFWLGRHELIAPHAARAVELLRGESDPWQLSYALVMLAIGGAESDPAAAEPLLDEAAALARTQGARTVLLVFALYWHGRLSLGRGNLELAERLLTEAHEIGVAIRHPPAIAHPLAMLGQVEVKRGSLDRAAGHLRQALRIHHEYGDVLGTIWSIEGLARLAERTGRPGRAAEMLAWVGVERERIGTAWSPAEREGFEALAAQLEQALGADAFGAVCERGKHMTFADVVALALADEPSGHLGVETVPAGAPPIARTNGPTLTVQALGALRIARDGETLGREAWASAKARELLLFLLCHPEGRTREQVGLAFWPDASTEQVRNNFHVTLHRLRKTLGGPEWVRLTGERYAMNPDAAIDFDAARFERDVSQALARARRDGDTSPLESALASYRGDFLEHEAAGDWHLELRDHLRRKYVDAATALATLHMERERWNEAGAAWRLVVARDELDERAYRGLMTCHARLGERSLVHELYQRLARALQRDLEVEPDPETTQLYHRLTVSQPSTAA